MTRSGRPWALHFVILGTAAFALLGIFLVRDIGERTSGETPLLKADETPVVRTTEMPGPQALPGVDPARGEWVTAEGSASVRDAKPTAPAGAATPAGVQDRIPHPGEGVDPAIIVALHGHEPLTRNHPHVAEAIEVQERNNYWIMSLAQVVGTAIGLNDKGQVALMVYTKAETTDIPDVLEDLPVVVHHMGEILAWKKVAVQDASPSGKISGKGKGGKGGGGGGKSADPTA